MQCGWDIVSHIAQEHLPECRDYCGSCMHGSTIHLSFGLAMRWATMLEFNCVQKWMTLHVYIDPNRVARLSTDGS